MKLVRVIAAGLIVGLSLPPAAAYAQGAAAAQRRAQQEALRQQQPRPQAPPPKAQPPRESPPRDQGQSNRDRPEPPQPSRLVSLNQAVDSVRRSTPGHLLDASPPSGGSRPVYVIRWQADSGQRIDFVVDAQTGAIVGRNGR